jgi:hypothetical protein
LVSEYGVTDPHLVGNSAQRDGELAKELAEPVWIYFYDGDSGECMRTILPS